MLVVHVLIHEAEDSLPGCWIGHCLDFDIISQGNTPRHAMAMIEEAIDITIRDDFANNLDTFQRNKAPQEDWQLFDRAQRETVPDVYACLIGLQGTSW